MDYIKYGKAPPEKGTFFRLEVYKRVGIFFHVLKYSNQMGKLSFIKRDFSLSS